LTFEVLNCVLRASYGSRSAARVVGGAQDCPARRRPGRLQQRWPKPQLQVIAHSPQRAFVPGAGGRRPETQKPKARGISMHIHTHTVPYPYPYPYPSAICICVSTGSEMRWSMELGGLVSTCVTLCWGWGLGFLPGPINAAASGRGGGGGAFGGALGPWPRVAHPSRLSSAARLRVASLRAADCCFALCCLLPPRQRYCGVVLFCACC
jgi:hypothetical protein